MHVIPTLMLALGLAAAQKVPEPYGWSCQRLASKRSWPQCASVPKSQLQACLCSLPEYVSLTETCLLTAVANDSDPETAVRRAREMSLCPLSTVDFHKEPMNPITPAEIETAVSTAYWRLHNDRVAQRAGAALVGYWGVVILLRYAAHLLGARISRSRFVLWGPVRQIRAYILNAPLARRHHSQPWYGIRLPTRSATLVLILFAVLNYTLIAVDYPYADLNFIYPTHSQQRNKSLEIRCAYMIMWKLPLVFLFATRNNICLMAGHPWSLDTFNLFHKWISRMTVIDVFIHGIAISLVKSEQGLYKYVWSVEYWRWGVAGALILATIFLQSFYWISRNYYEAFKVLHTVLAVVFVVAAWYHVSVLPYGTQHMYAIVAIWGFDGLIRLVRISLAGRVRGYLHHYSRDVMTITLTRPRSYDFSFQSAFLFVHLPPFYWQSHPFTIMHGFDREDESSEESLAKDFSSHSIAFKGKEIVLGVKAQSGITRKLARMNNGPISLAVDGPYGAALPLQRFDQLIMIAGGIGINAHLSHLQHLKRTGVRKWPQIKLYWAVRTLAGFEWVLTMLDEFSDHVSLEIYSGDDTSVSASTSLRSIEFGTVLYTHLNAMAIVRTEVDILHASKTPGTTAILACGPGSLNDDARLAACWAIENSPSFVDYFEDAFSW